jgi:hypothetical protein
MLLSGSDVTIECKIQASALIAAPSSYHVSVSQCSRGH